MVDGRWRAPTPTWWQGSALLLAVAGLATVVWACATQWGGTVHGHPSYVAVLALTVLGSLAAAWSARRPRPGRSRWRQAAGVGVLLLGLGWIAATGWLRPLSAVEPALAAMGSDAEVTVTETPTRITLTPTAEASRTGVFFQPGAKVDPRAYAAVLRPLAEAGHPVVVVKPPLGVAFLALGAFDDVREDHPEVSRWVVGGHSLGGVVAAMEADAADDDARGPAVGLLLHASYPATDISSSLTAQVASISGSRDGLSTPARIEASRQDLPDGARFTAVQGAVHAFFGDYGPQRGDGTPTANRDVARDEISRASLAFVEGLSDPR